MGLSMSRGGRWGRGSDRGNWNWVDGGGRSRSLAGGRIRGRVARAMWFVVPSLHWSSYLP